MKLNKDAYLDKLRGCFLGKNIGGTIGGPFEGRRELLHVEGFTTKKGEPLPNDDLDLQLVWLQAMEDEGPQHIDSETLGEYWQSFITPYWNEYGISKVNMSRGLMPSVAGDADDNIWAASNGAWIRTEIWAGFAPGAIDTAVRYAIEDGLVDHGMGEGTQAAAFVAALESAAYFIDDVNELLSIGLSKISPDSRVHKSVAMVQSEFRKGTPFEETRNKIVKLNSDIGDGWFQAPSNVAFVVIGLLYGGGDFKKSMLAAVNCGDDTDCTGATIGSIMGIMKGEKGIPADWKEYIGERITTCSINCGVSFRFPKDISELVRRVAAQAPYVLLANKDNVGISEGKTEISDEEKAGFKRPFGKDDERDAMRALIASMRPKTFKIRTGPLTTIVTYVSGPEAKVGQKAEIEVNFTNNIKAYGNEGHEAKVSLLLPPGAEADAKEAEIYVPCWTPMTKMATAGPIRFGIRFNGETESAATVLMRVSVLPRGREYCVPVRFLLR